MAKKEKEVLTAKEAFEQTDLTFRNHACGIPENLILSTDKEKIYQHVSKLIQAKSMKGEFYLNVMIYGEKQKQIFMDVAQRLRDIKGYSFVIINGTKAECIMCAIISWKNAKDVGYKPYIKYAKINV